MTLSLLFSEKLEQARFLRTILSSLFAKKRRNCLYCFQRKSKERDSRMTWFSIFFQATIHISISIQKFIVWKKTKKTISEVWFKRTTPA